jgi:hypothetical protein
MEIKRALVMSKVSTHLSAVLLCLCVMMQPSMSVIKYIDWGVGITTFPHDIPGDVEVIDIYSTSITVIDYIEPFSQLVGLILPSNALTTMPDLSNVSSTIQEVNLNGNNIVVIDYLPYMPMLRKFKITYNSLNTFPDLTNVAGLLEMSAEGNELVSIDYLPFMPDLLIFDVSQNLLTQFPDLTNISTSLQTFIIYENYITEVDYIPMMPALRIFDIATNMLTTFPDLTNISSSIENLYFDCNAISTVDYIPSMPSLRSFSLFQNSLTAFPDMTKVATLLEYLNLAGNSISEIPDHLLSLLTQLNILGLGNTGGSPIKIPNACYMGRNENLTLQLFTDQVVCDHTAVYAKLASAAGKLILSPQTGPLLCASPPELAGQLYNNVGIEALLTHSNSKCYLISINPQFSFK